MDNYPNPTPTVKQKNIKIPTEALIVAFIIVLVGSIFGLIIFVNSKNPGTAQSSYASPSPSSELTTFSPPPQVNTSVQGAQTQNTQPKPAGPTAPKKTPSPTPKPSSSASPTPSSSATATPSPTPSSTAVTLSCSASPNPATLPDGGSVEVTWTATAGGGGGSFKYTWSGGSGDDAVTGSEQTSKKTYTTTGTKNAHIKVEDANNSSNSTDMECPTIQVN